MARLTLDLHDHGFCSDVRPIGVNFSMACAGYVSTTIRFLISLVFIGSFLVKPILAQPLSLIWRRIVESDKPIFTLLFGGISSGAVVVNELGKHL